MHIGAGKIEFRTFCPRNSVFLSNRRCRILAS